MSKAETVLIVDDDRLAQATFRVLLELKGYRVLLAEDGDEALQLLRHHPVDVVLLDILMPNKDGIETLIEIRRRMPGLPVLVISGGGVRKRQDLLSLALKFGASATLSKPLSSQQVLQYLDNACGQAA
jgi:CheY-like chemotaxis protein